MGDPSMALAESELIRIGEYVKGNLREWIREIYVPQPDPVTNTMLLERTAVLETELRAQRELMEAKFDAVDRRFEAMDRRFVERFEAVDKRFEAVDRRFETIDKRFETIDKRFGDQNHHMDKRFALMTWMLGILVAGVGTTIAIIAL